jgi:hypothetical protein
MYVQTGVHSTLARQPAGPENQPDQPGKQAGQTTESGNNGPGQPASQTLAWPAGNPRSATRSHPVRLRIRLGRVTISYLES